ncbi:hypothetical protein CTAYLR_000006 [Chrysophaeum taylorii]|uniref:EGF-like domain-containing protein n=1 Tax=Chrysophaeum taylorii TaxID=2483200 RepID=A0AAD7UGK1_9STRA|nr:hypothetical protein CTAYLR_000006 [Chrysophaeum taylorii]
MRWALLVISLTVSIEGCPVGYENGEICSGHGHCAENTSSGLDETCVCDDGFAGGDCSQRICPSGRAWVDVATGNNTAHGRYVECSDMGYCDRYTGVCACREGFTGSACDRLRCPTATDSVGRARECNGVGRCLSMREAATQQDFVSLWYADAYEEWDSDMVYGCACDAGWTGYDCSERECPRGDDPLTDGVDEVQLIDCRCSRCNGTLALEFRGQRTAGIPHDATAELVEYYLETLSTITDVEVRYIGTSNDASLCDERGTTTAVTFVREFGDLPSLNATPGEVVVVDGSTSLSIASDGATSSLRSSVSSVRGTKEWIECSGRGSCDRGTGLCDCYLGFSMSDGRGSKGLIGDCGAVDANETAESFLFDGSSANNATGPCPKARPRWSDDTIAKVCSGAGTCAAQSSACNCSRGYDGDACEYKSCPVDRAWWDEASPKGAHLDATCSAAGTCDRTEGECSCGDLFEGDACQLLACPANKTQTCGEHGTCSTMAEFAEKARRISQRTGRLIAVNYSDPWDAYKLRGCLCDASEGVWRSDTSSTSYRGPFAYAYTDWTGYTCAHAMCPTGDNPFMIGRNEIQAINCTAATAGSFNVTFREAHSVELPTGASAAKVERELERLATIRDVTVTFAAAQENNNNNSNATLCASDQYVTVEFESERGDLPPLVVVDATNLAGGTVNITEVTKGTKGDLECAAAGICNREIGQCACLDGFYSGADIVPFRQKLGAVGQRGDCSFRHAGTKETKWENPLFVYSYSFALTSTGQAEVSVGALDTV